MNPNVTIEASNADRVRSAIGGANGVYISDVKDCGNDRFTAIVQFNSQPVHGHRDSAWIVSKQLTKHNIDHTIESSTEKSAVGDGLNGKYGVWEHLVSVHIHHPETLKPAYINEETMLSLKNSIDENRILELVHKKFFKENGRDPKNAKELLSFAKKKNGKTADCDKAVEKHEKDLHEGAVGLVVNVLNGRKLYSVDVDASKEEIQQRLDEHRLDEVFDNTPKGRAKWDRYHDKAHDSWVTNRDAVDGAAARKDWKAAEKYDKRLARRNKGQRLADKIAGKWEIDEVLDNTPKGRAKLDRYRKKAHKSWITNFDAEVGAEADPSNTRGKYASTATIAGYRRERAKRAKGLELAIKKIR